MHVRPFRLSSTVVLGAATLGVAGAAMAAGDFADPVRLVAGGELVKVEAPGYAAPTFFDVDGDGNGDLIVGQFAGGKMRVYPGNGSGQFESGSWLMAGGKIAEVPGVW